MQGYEYFVLNNGIRIIHKQAEGEVAHLGVIINAGSRDEEDSEHGIAHFIEHVIFKGTQKRKAYHVISRLEDVGGEIDAYTTKEETAIYAGFLKEYYSRTLELFADIIFNSSFPEKELEKEKEVILDEINSYKDSPAELIFDDFEELIFKGHPIGRSILGEPKSLKKYKRKHLQHFLQKNYNTNQMVICSVGDVKFSKLLKWAKKYFEEYETNTRITERKPLNGYDAQIIEQSKDTYQAHCILGNRAYAITDKKRLPLELLNNILGGPGMNSRLNMALREKHGYTYNIESFYNPYTDTGIFGIYFGTEVEKVERSMKIIEREIKKLKEKPLGILQMERAKKQLIVQMAIGAENKSSLMLNIGRSYLLFDTVDPLEKVYEKVNSVNAMQLQEVANEIFDFKKLSTLLYK
ncbi:MAG: pitrilysin family protein [Salinivirgaceae bacterium]|nr:pitrilysin family protein [Salinivirgaceae bacterium]